jgi:putative transposase
MSQSLSRILVHLIFSTKHRLPLLVPAVHEPLKAYLITTLQEIESPSIQLNCVPDHAHILCCLSKNLSVSKVVEEVKKSSSKWLKEQGPELVDFYWQAGYGAFSVSQSSVESVKQYIQEQEAHHRRVTFQDEFRLFLKKHGVEYDERYVWD